MRKPSRLAENRKKVPSCADTLCGWVLTNRASKWEWPAVSGMRNFSNVWNLSRKPTSGDILAELHQIDTRCKRIRSSRSRGRKVSL